ncbi:REP-associated tyrosine transposase [Pseudomonas sp. SST3]|uniref:REP-associated tyrosine transposase n=1 Tax=Pseudomonas sp. SST3 TaxID=2267882 RepID=UPI000E011378|nr:transposase [Pseudomonas sp. SST3]NKQ11796.1 transposase [Pseudomonas sp. SST3]
MDAYSASNRLRKGRWSVQGQIYLVTTVAQHRKPVFRDMAAARALIRTMQSDEARGTSKTWAFVVMPDHLHWLVQLGQGTLPQLVGRVKSISARYIGQSVWQAGFHDRALRREEDLRSVARYIVANPLRAGLVDQIGDYPHWDAAWL